MSDIIKHRGRVEKVDGSHLVVRIIQTSACSACSMKGHCNASESKEKLIDVYDVDISCQIGEEVILCGTTSMGMRAVFLAFAVPLFVLMIVLGISMHLSDGDALLSSLIAFFSITLYYLIIYLNKSKLGKTFSFKIEKQ